MTEAEWNTSDDLDPALSFVAARDRKPGAITPPVLLTDRKLRLFTVGCCRRHWHLFVDSSCAEAVEVGERFADGEADHAERERAEDSCLAVSREASHARDKVLFEVAHAAAVTCYSDPELRRPLLYYGGPGPQYPAIRAGDAAHRVQTALIHPRLTADQRQAAYQAMRDAERATQADLLRCVAGNPFRPVAADPRWFTSTAISLAEAIYADRAFDRLPILADALEDAGCDHPDVLAHCRTHPEHARGCWVIDLVLRKF